VDYCVVVGICMWFDVYDVFSVVVIFVMVSYGWGCSILVICGVKVGELVSIDVVGLLVMILFLVSSVMFDGEFCVLIGVEGFSWLIGLG